MTEPCLAFLRALTKKTWLLLDWQAPGAMLAWPFMLIGDSNRPATAVDQIQVAE